MLNLSAHESDTPPALANRRVRCPRSKRCWGNEGEIGRKPGWRCRTPTALNEA